MSRFDECLLHVLLEESGEVQTGLPYKRGKYSYMNHPADPGGATMMGITHRVYDAWRTSRGMPVRDVRQIEDSEIAAIYREQYWKLVRGDELPAGLDLAVFDFGVNSGPVQAIRSLQRALGVNIDGQLGVATIAACKAADAATLLDKYMDGREAFGRSLKNYLPFRNGWETRWQRIRKAAAAMIDGHPAPVAVAAADIVPPAPKAMEDKPQPWGPWATVTGYASAILAAISTVVEPVFKLATEAINALKDLGPLKSAFVEAGANARAIGAGVLVAAITRALTKLRGP